MSEGPVGQIRAFDVSIFQKFSQTTPSDRRSLLIVQNLVRNLAGRYHYAEIVSHLGGTLLPHLLDPLCVTAFSIDKRPLSQPDERGRSFDYVGNSTARMLDNLKAHASDADLLKLTTFDGDASELPAGILASAPNLVFIDGEHTNRAVFSDFVSLFPSAPRDCVFAFHDGQYVTDGLIIIEIFLRYLGVRHKLSFLPDSVAVILLGDYVASAPALDRHARDRETFVSEARSSLLEKIANNQKTRSGTPPS